jgi:hypothetical protein
MIEESDLGLDPSCDEPKNPSIRTQVPFPVQIMKSFLRIAQQLLFSIVALVLMGTVLLAKDSAAPVEPEVRSFILPYTLVTLGSFLAVFVACRPGRRQKETKLQKALEDE